VRVFARIFVTELMAGLGGPGREALFRRKGDEARNYGFAFIGGRPEGPYLPRMGRARGVWFIGDYTGDIGTYAFCLVLVGRPQRKLSTA